MNDIKITVFTPAYNRKHTLGRAYESLKKQTCKEFVWLIIDDGSVDGTDDYIESIMEIEKEFKIKYYRKENGGRHTAVNYSYQFIETEYVVTLDSDDELVPEGIERMLSCISAIPKEEYDRFWCVSGREIDSQTGKIVGDLYPSNINNLVGKKQRKQLLKISGEKHCCRKTDILKQYKFPVYPETKFVIENEVWEKINRKFDQYCVNEVFGIYHTESEDGIVNGGMHNETMNYSLYYGSLFYINDLFDELLYNKFVFIFLMNITKYGLLLNIPLKDTLAKIDKWYKRAFVTLAYPISVMRVSIKGKNE